MNALWLMRNSRLIVGLGPSNKRAARPRLLGRGSCRLERHPSAGVEEVEIVQWLFDLGERGVDEVNICREVLINSIEMQRRSSIA
jgi:hypothetical protein